MRTRLRTRKHRGIQTIETFLYSFNSSARVDKDGIPSRKSACERYIRLEERLPVSACENKSQSGNLKVVTTLDVLQEKEK